MAGPRFHKSRDLRRAETGDLIEQLWVLLDQIERLLAESFDNAPCKALSYAREKSACEKRNNLLATCWTNDMESCRTELTTVPRVISPLPLCDEAFAGARHCRREHNQPSRFAVVFEGDNSVAASVVASDDLRNASFDGVDHMIQVDRLRRNTKRGSPMHAPDEKFPEAHHQSPETVGVCERKIGIYAIFDVR